MKGIYQVILLTSIGFFAAITSSKAQLYEVPLDEKIRESSLIVEGKVCAKQSFRHNGEVYTVNRVEVSKVLKGSLDGGNGVNIITWGGDVDSVHVFWSHLLELSIEEEGLFFLHPSDIPSQLSGFEGGTHDVYSSSQGFLKYSVDRNRNIIASEPFHRYSSINGLFRHIADRTGENLRNTDGSESSPRTGVRYVFKNFAMSGSTIEFDIFVNGLYQDYYDLYQSGIKLQYNDFFGQSISSNGLVQLTADEVASSSSYQLSTSDISENELGISLTTVGSISGLNDISTTEKAFAHGKLTVSDPFTAPEISFNLDSILPLNRYWDSGTSQHLPFDTIIFEHEFKPHSCMPANIKFDPKEVAGGIGQILTITGNCFGEYEEGVSRVEFQNARIGPAVNDWVTPILGDYHVSPSCPPSLILCWTDTLIKVRVPSIGLTGPDSPTDVRYAGTGPIMVCNKDALCGISSTLQEDLLFVRYSADNHWTEPDETPSRQARIVTLRNANGLGGMSVTYMPSFAADTAAVAAFERALRKWKCATGVNFNVDQSTSNSNASDTITVRYGSLPGGVSSSIGVTAPKWEKCEDSSSGEILKSNMQKFQVYFKQTGVSWHKSEDLTGLDSTKNDMESIALHELGHAHLLNHVNQKEDPMYFFIDKGVARRDLNDHNIEGGLHIMGISAVNYPNSNCGSAMSPADTTGLDCYLINAVPDLHTELGKLFLLPNPVSSTLTFHFESSSTIGYADITITDMYGRPVIQKGLDKKANGLRSTIDMTALPKGMYVFTMSFGSKGMISKQFIKQ